MVSDMTADEDINRLHRDIGSVRRRFTNARLRLLEAGKRVDLLLNNASWQITEPLRRIARACPSIGQLGWPAFGGTWWLAYGEQPARAWPRTAVRIDRPFAPSDPPCVGVRQSNIGHSRPAADLCATQLDRGAGFRSALAIDDVLLFEGRRIQKLLVSIGHQAQGWTHGAQGA